MKKKIQIILLFLLLLVTAAIVTGATEAIYDDYIYSGEQIAVEGNNLRVLIASTNDKIFASLGGIQKVVEIDGCETIVNIQICLEDIVYDSRRGAYKAKIKVESLASLISITRTISKSDLLIDEEAIVNVKVENGGQITASSLNYIDDFPDEIKIVDIDGCSTENNKVFLSVSLAAGAKKECTYTIKAIDEIDRTLKAKITYIESGIEKEIYSTPITIKATSFFDIGLGLAQNVSVGSGVKLIINLTNKLNKSIDVDYLDIRIPNGLEFVSTSTIKKYINATDYIETGQATLTKISKNLYRWHGTLVNDKIIVILLKGKTAGLNTFTVKAEYEKDNFKRIAEKQKSVNVITKDLIIEDNLEETLESNQQKILKITLKNPSQIDYNNVHIKFKTNLTFVDDIYLNKVEKGSSKKIVELLFITPEVDAVAEFPFDIELNYEFNGKKLKSIITKKIKVKPVQKLAITQTLSKKDVEEADIIQIKVDIKNERSVDVADVHVSDKLVSDNVSLKLKTSIIDLIRANATTSYLYSIVAPSVEKETTFYINTTVKYRVERDYAFSEVSSFKVRPKKILLEVEKSVKTTAIKGETVNIDYRITNKDDEEVVDLILKYPQQTESDLIGSNIYFIGMLAPGETVNLIGKERIRPKVNGTIKLKPAFVEFKDRKGKLFSVNSTTATLNVIDTIITGPAIIIEKIVPENIAINKEFNVYLKLNNIGNVPADVSMYDNNKVYTIRVYPEKERNITYSLKFNTAGTKTLKKAIAGYTYNGKNYSAFSNKAVVNVLNATPKIKEVEKKEIKKETAKRKTLVERFIAAVKNFFSRFFK